MNMRSHRGRQAPLWKPPDGTTIAVRHEVFAGAAQRAILPADA
jgi:hypothetical protein